MGTVLTVILGLLGIYIAPAAAGVSLIVAVTLAVIYLRTPKKKQRLRRERKEAAHRAGMTSLILCVVAAALWLIVMSVLSHM